MTGLSSYKFTPASSDIMACSALWNAFSSSLITCIETQFEILRAMDSSGPHGENTSSGAWKRARMSAPVQTKEGRGRDSRCTPSSPGVKVLLLMKETELSCEMVDQRRPRRKSELARVEEGPGSIAMKLFRVMARRRW